MTKTRSGESIRSAENMLKASIKELRLLGYGRMLQIANNLIGFIPMGVMERSYYNALVGAFAGGLTIERCCEIISRVWYCEDTIGSITPDGSICYGSLSADARHAHHAEISADSLFAGQVPPIGTIAL